MSNALLFSKRIEACIFNVCDPNFESGQLMEEETLLMAKQSCGTTRHIGLSFATSDLICGMTGAGFTLSAMNDGELQGNGR